MNIIETIHISEKPKVFKKPDPFLKDVILWFSGKKDGHMGKWQYFDPNFEGDPARGSLLWTEWAQTDFYMLTNQAELIKNNAKRISELTGNVDSLLDFGPGEENAVTKNTLPFVNAYEETLESYIPVDLCDSYAYEAAELVRNGYKNITCYPKSKDFTHSLILPSSKKSTALCFGSIIGNYEGKQNTKSSIPMLIKELKNIKQNLALGSYLIVGLDTNQSEKSLYESYDHDIHAAYEINVLYKIKRDLIPNEDGFIPDAWKYRMAWYPESYQFCHIAEATENQKFTIDGFTFEISKGDQLVVDNSFKFPTGVFQQASIFAGYEPQASYLDDSDRMALHVIKAA